MKAGTRLRLKPRLTAKQRAALNVLDDTWRTPRWLAAQLGTSPEGAAMTAGSLIRHGLAQRTRDGGHIYYRAVTTRAVMS